MEHGCRGFSLIDFRSVAGVFTGWAYSCHYFAVTRRWLRIRQEGGEERVGGLLVFRVARVMGRCSGAGVRGRTRVSSWEVECPRLAECVVVTPLPGGRAVEVGTA